MKRYEVLLVKRYEIEVPDDVEECDLFDYLAKAVEVEEPRDATLDYDELPEGGDDDY